MPVLAHLPYLFNAAQGQASIHTLRWQDRPLQCPHGQSHHIGRWGTYRYHPGCKNATGVIAAGAPATTSPIRCCTRASGLWRTGSWPPFWCALPVHRGAWPGKWVSKSGPAIAGAGVCTMRPCPMAMQPQVEGTVDADELYPTAGQKGQAKQGGKNSLGRRARGRRKKSEPGAL
jgi:hypothetical protein